MVTNERKRHHQSQRIRVAGLRQSRARGNSTIPYGHNVTTSAISGNTDVVTFKAIIDHVYRLKAANVIGNPNLEELFSMRSNPRRKRMS